MWDDKQNVRNKSEERKKAKILYSNGSETWTEMNNSAGSEILCIQGHTKLNKI
jgi:hypothetical protein